MLIYNSEFPTNIRPKPKKMAKKINFQAKSKYFLQVRGPLGREALHLSVISLLVGPA